MAFCAQRDGSQTISSLLSASFLLPVNCAERILSDSSLGGCLLGEMQLLSDAQLLAQYARQGSEAGFGEIVARHANLFYSAALRQVRSPEAARDVTQTVFMDLARKSGSLARKLPADGSIVGWLYRSTRFAALNSIRNDQRRQNTETQVMDNPRLLSPEHDDTLDWDRVRPLLDAAISSLCDKDRDALLLRFFQNQDFRRVGTALGISEDAAQKRVSRALEKLRRLLARQGITTTGVALSAAISAHAVQSAPATLISALTKCAIAGAAAPVTGLAATKAVAVITSHKAIAGAVLILLLWATVSAIFEWPPLWHYAGGPLYPCADALGHIEACKRGWALETGQTNGTPVDPVQLERYVRTKGGLSPKYPMPHCPSGGIYTYGNVGQLPTCSLATNALPTPVKERVGFFGWRWKLPPSQPESHVLTPEWMEQHTVPPEVLQQLAH
jgi:RNA polymerase sigma factor (sigma-70 family)